jgi:hypothetical protein
MYESTGTIQYRICDETGNRSVVLWIDEQIVKYYRSFLDRRVFTKLQKYKAHISIVRKDTIEDLSNWGKYEGQTFKFYYDGIIKNGIEYYWIDAYSLDLEKVRSSLGLAFKSYPGRIPVTGFNTIFHFSIGNIK